ncbi:MAG TPA: PDZ domain-containing protein [Planctomycetota bacterium]
MRRNIWAWLFLVFLFCFIAGLFVRQQMRNSRKKPHTPAPPRPAKGSSAAQTTQPEKQPPTTSHDLRFADDEESKRGPFWVEQTFEVAGKKGTSDLLDLYLSFDPDTGKGLRVRLSSSGSALERLDAADRTTVLSKGVAPQISAGETALGVLWRRGELTVWLGSQQLLSWSPDAAAQKLLLGRSGCQILGDGVRTGALRTLALDAIHFEDSFMRNSSNGVWRAFCGKWELTALAFPERSANPFSLRASFGAEEADADPLYKDRTREEDGAGLGVMLSSYEGTLHIARITGGAPAARAGLQEDDIILAVDGRPLNSEAGWEMQQLLQRTFTRDVQLRILRPGEKAPRDVNIIRDQYRWGTATESVPIPVLSATPDANDGSVALILAGEPGWSDYAAEAAIKPLGDGGVGLAVAVTSPRDYVLFRWRGPDLATGSAAKSAGGEFDRLQLVRVSGGKESVLAERSGGYRPYEFYLMAVDWSGEQISCRIDGNEVLSARVPGLKRGQIGLYAMKGAPVFFDDVRVAADRGVLVAAHHPEREINDIFASENDMELWANPALEWDRNIETGWAVHKSRFPGEQALVINKPKFNDLEVRLRTGGIPQEGDSALKISGGKAVLGAGPTASSIAVPKTIQRVALRQNGRRFEADIDGAKLAFDSGIADGAPLARSQVAIRGLKNLGEPRAVHVTASNILEYTFNTSPVDWEVECGRWGLLNKWICDPRWSWFGGRTKTLAAIWNKYIFSGDISVEAAVSLMMQKEDPPYERPGDYNMTICGDGMNLDSGYTLIFAGDNNSWTRLYRKGVMVAESTLEDDRVVSDRVKHPDKPELHQRWFRVKFEKIGKTVSFYRDGHLAFSFDDPDPIPEGRVAFWTMDNGFLLARVRIAHSGCRAAPFEPRRAALYQDARVINRFDQEVLTRLEPQALPAAIETALSSPPDAFKPADADAETKVFAPLPGAFPPAYRVVNAVSGGPMALQWKNFIVDPEGKGILRFAYCIEPGAMVDLYLIDVSSQDVRSINPRQHGAFRWRLTGPRESNEYAPLAGEVPGVVADGRWHAIQFDLSQSWRMMWQQRGFNRPHRQAYRLMMGNLDNHGYLLAGMNGNHVGAAYSISNIVAYAPSELARTTPAVEKVIWPFDPAGDGRSMTIVFRAPSDGINVESLQAELNGIAVPRDMTVFDHLKQTLTIDLLRLNLPPLAQGTTLRLKLLGFEDRAQNPSAGGFSTTYTYDPQPAASAGKAVAAPVISVSVGPGGDFIPVAPLTLNNVVALPPVARLQPSDDAPPWAPAGQPRGIQVVNMMDGSAFGFALKDIRYSLRRFPYLQLEYRIPFETPVNLHIHDQNGAVHAVILTDIGDARDPLSHEIATRCGPPENFVSDGKWQRTTIPLDSLLSTAKAGWPSLGPRIMWMPPKSSQAASVPTEVTGLSLHDHGWRGNRRSMEYWIHRVQPLAAGRAEDLTFSWDAQDITGILEYATSVDEREDSDPQGKQQVRPGETLAAAQKRAGVAVKDGWNYLHVRVRNGAGVWSQPAHLKFFLDCAPPEVVRTEPAAGGNFAGQTLKFFVREDSGIDLDSLRLSVAGVVMSGGGRTVSRESGLTVVTFNTLAAGLNWAPGPVSVELSGLRDLLGNQAAAPYTFKFNAISERGGKGPAIAHLRFRAPVADAGAHRQMALETSFGLDFESHTGHVHAMRDCRMDWLDDPAQACFGRRAVRFTALDDDADVQIMLHKNAWYFDRMSLLHFDYKADPGMCVDVLVEVLGQWLTIRFTGDGSAAEGGMAAGKIDGVVADGTWRHASINLRKIIDAARPDLPVRIVSKIILSAHGRDGCKRGATLTLDNVDLCWQASAGGSFEWDAEPDPTGIAGYSFRLDQEPDAAPASVVNCAQTSQRMSGRRGIWYAHVQACNQAGNMGPVRTLRVDLGE